MTAALALPAPPPAAAPFAAEPRFAAPASSSPCRSRSRWRPMALDPRLFQGDDIWLKPVKFQIALTIYFLTLAFFARWLPAGMTAGARWRVYAGARRLRHRRRAALDRRRRDGRHRLALQRDDAADGGALRRGGRLRGDLHRATLVMGIAIWRNPATGLPPRCASRSASGWC